VAANQQWIAANEQEILKWNINEQNRQIRFEFEDSLGGTE
jgi:hypothetical protein